MTPPFSIAMPTVELSPLRRLVCTLALGCLLIVLGGLLRVRDHSMLVTPDTWKRKARWVAVADWLAVGDSQTWCGVDPRVLGEEMGTVPPRPRGARSPSAQDVGNRPRIRNFAFLGTGLGIDYLRAAEAAWVPVEAANGDRVLLVGINAFSFLPFMSDARAWRDYAKAPPPSAWREHLGPWFAAVAEPSSLEEMTMSLYAHATGGAKVRAREDGWGACPRFMNGAAAATTVRGYEEMYRRHRVSAEAIHRFLQYVKEARGRGVRVFGFRPPTHPGILQAERQTGFDEGAFRADFLQAGGMWIQWGDPADAVWAPTDGVHLDPAGAALFSRALGRAMRPHLVRPDTDSGPGGALPLPSGNEK